MCVIKVPLYLFGFYTFVNSYLIFTDFLLRIKLNGLTIYKFKRIQSRYRIYIFQLLYVVTYKLGHFIEEMQLKKIK